MSDCQQQDHDQLARRRLHTTVYSQCFSPCGKYLAACDNFGYLTIFSVSDALGPEATQDSYKPFFQFKASNGALYCLAATQRLLISAGTGNIQGWSWTDILAKTPKVLWSLDIPQKLRVDTLTSPEVNSLVLDDQDSRCHLFAGCGDNNIHIWDLDCGEHILTLEGHQDYVHSLSLKSNGHQCLSSSEDGSVRIWDIRSRLEPMHIIEPYKDPKCARPQFGKWLGSVAVDAAEDWMVCGGGPRMCLWHLRSLASTTVFDTPGATTNHVMFYADTMISAGSEAYVHHWSVNGDLRARVPCTPTCVFSVAINNKENSKVLSMAGSSPKIDVCTNFGYRAFSLEVC